MCREKSKILKDQLQMRTHTETNIPKQKNGSGENHFRWDVVK